MFNYVCLGSDDLARSGRFYDAVLGALGLSRCAPTDEPGWNDIVGWGRYGPGGQHELALWLCRPFNGAAASAGNGSMVALIAADWDQVRRAHQAALAHGGTCEGAPGLRTHYNPDFYAAYVRDPDGNKLALVCRGFVSEPGPGAGGG